MLRHIVAWNHKEEFSEAQKKDNAGKVKKELESLADLISEVKELKVYINTLPTGNRDMILDSLFENEEALAAYQVHPEHKRVSALVGSVTQDRACIDYIE